MLSSFSSNSSKHKRSTENRQISPGCKVAVVEEVVVVVVGHTPTHSTTITRCQCWSAMKVESMQRQPTMADGQHHRRQSETGTTLTELSSSSSSSSTPASSQTSSVTGTCSSATGWPIRCSTCGTRIFSSKSCPLSNSR